MAAPVSKAALVAERHDRRIGATVLVQAAYRRSRKVHRRAFRAGMRDGLNFDYKVHSRIGLGVPDGVFTAPAAGARRSYSDPAARFQ